jgi:hypothetical protein
VLTLAVTLNCFAKDSLVTVYQLDAFFTLTRTWQTIASKLGHDFPSRIRTDGVEVLGRINQRSNQVKVMFLVRLLDFLSPETMATLPHLIHKPC